MNSSNEFSNLENKEILTLEIEGLPPTVNMMYRGMRGHRYKTQSTLEYQNYVSGRLRKIWGNKSPYDGRIEFSITYHTHNRLRWDIDNRVKALQDCLSLAGVIKDDSQVDSLIVKRVIELNRARDWTVLRLSKYE